ncbi:hypothetical protein CPQG_00050 [Cyanophage P-RSM3]|mgnify:FL=1|jgi:hypothetical protein|uniref:Uncharacterized protein n=3 Tax=Ronodorvirus ssm4 TaxID=2845939 RepID=M1PK89_9CAUD|nr:hypothetical protein PSSM4_041 [Prochlorococcus phage P-SSM4]AAX46842.1 hypothetical protein PSSM4_041 [Prochlorococcus phage P-SSM4]AGF91345.1 hypothetical protein CPYG_00050 [Cyanophage P-SS1]AGH26579.1 hypothetical protein CPQG_00050 [Cyanophage P-RSM3]|tara:strand:- start:268 stop:459 length:192 start_codon:yes stop_codon:yes gene_type:complete
MDRHSIDIEESKEIKYNRGLDLFIESLLKPDPKLRGCAHNQGCYDELIEIRDTMVEYVKTLRK